MDDIEIYSLWGEYPEARFSLSAELESWCSVILLRFFHILFFRCGCWLDFADQEVAVRDRVIVVGKHDGGGSFGEVRVGFIFTFSEALLPILRTKVNRHHLLAI